MGRFVPRKEREIELGEKAKRFTNVYVKNFNEAMTEEDLQKMFEKFGKITSLKVCICSIITIFTVLNKGKMAGESRLSVT